MALLPSRLEKMQSQPGSKCKCHGEKIALSLVSSLADVRHLRTVKGGCDSYYCMLMQMAKISGALHTGLRLVLPQARNSVHIPYRSGVEAGHVRACLVTIHNRWHI